jgi:hypothetical protein
MSPGWLVRKATAKARLNRSHAPEEHECEQKDCSAKELGRRRENRWSKRAADLSPYKRAPGLVVTPALEGQADSGVCLSARHLTARTISLSLSPSDAPAAGRCR